MPDFTLETADKLRRTVGDLTRAIQRIEGTPAGQIETLGFLFREGPQSIAQLARSRRVRHQSMSSTVTDLESRGLVARSRDPQDGRGVLIELTEAGADVIRESRISRSTLLLEAAERVLTPDERSTLAQAAELLGRIRDDVASG